MNQEQETESDSTRLERELEHMAELAKRMARAVRMPHADLTPTQIVAISVLEQRPLRIGALAALMDTAQNTVSEMVARLERAGLVAKSRDPHDRRAVLVMITDAGRASLKAHREAMRNVHRQLLQALPDTERRRLIEAFELLVDLAERARC